jgi:hypothetical protein
LRIKRGNRIGEAREVQWFAYVELPGAGQPVRLAAEMPVAADG